MSFTGVVDRVPLFAERRSRKAWRHDVAMSMLERLEDEGALRFVGTRPEDRREMLQIAALLPTDVIAELYEDASYPGYTFLELRPTPTPIEFNQGFRVIHPRNEEAV